MPPLGVATRLDGLSSGLTRSLNAQLCTDTELSAYMQGHTPLHLCADSSRFGGSEGGGYYYDSRTPSWTDLAVALLDHGAYASIRNHKASTYSSCTVIH